MMAEWERAIELLNALDGLVKEIVRNPYLRQIRDEIEWLQVLRRAENPDPIRV